MSTHIPTRRRTARTIAVITLPVVLGACVSWQPQELTELPELINREQPDEIRVRSGISGTQSEIEQPQAVGETVSGSSDDIKVSVPFPHLADTRIRKVDKVKTTFAVLGIASLVALGFALANYETPLNVFERTGWCPGSC